MNKADAIDILQHSSSASNLLQVLEIIDRYEEPVNFTNTPFAIPDTFAHKNAAAPEALSRHSR